MIKEGDLVRTLSTSATLPNAVGVALDYPTFRGRELKTRVYVAFLLAERIRRRYVRGLLRITPDQLTDEECAAVMKWMLSRGA